MNLTSLKVSIALGILCAGPYSFGQATKLREGTQTTGALPTSQGGTGNAFTKFSGPTTTEKTKTLRDAHDTVLELGGSYTPTGTFTNMILVTPALGTPSAINLTNGTALPVAGITSSTSTALGVGSIELGHATDTTLTRASSGRVAVEGAPVPTSSSTDTFSNKTIVPRVVSTASSGTPTPDADSTDIYILTALAANATFGAPTGIPVQGQAILIRITDNATARTLAWNAAYTSVGATLPLTTVISTPLYVLVKYNTGTSKWECLATSNDPLTINVGTGFTIGGAAASGKVLVGNGTNYVASTPTFPNASATSRKNIVSDGTNWVASTETWAVPGTSGNVLTSNGTNWLSSGPPAGGSITLHGDSIYTILSTDRIVATSATLSTSRTWTLPAANTLSAGVAISVIDLARGVTSANKLTVTKAGSDTMEPQAGGNSLTLSTAGAGYSFTSDGTSKWYCSPLGFGNATVLGGGFLIQNADSNGFQQSAWALPTGVPASGKILIGNSATSATWSTPTYPNSASTTGKILQSDGTNIVMSTATWPTTNTAGYSVVGGGTNYAAYPTSIFASSTTSASAAYASDTYLAGSAVTVAAGDFKAQGQYHCVFDMVKTGAGTATPTIDVRIGTAGTTSDTSRITFTFGAGTAVADTGTFEVFVVFRTVGSGTSAVVSGICRATHNLATTGLFNNAASWTIVGTVSGGFATNAATKIGLSFNGGTSFSGTNTVVQADLKQP